MPEAPAIPSPGDVVADGMKELGGTPPATEAKPPAETPKVEAKTEPPKGLSDALGALTDEPPVSKETPPAKPADALTDEPHEGEKPAQFIKRLKAERADALNQTRQLKEQLAKHEGKHDASDEVKRLQTELADRDKHIELHAYERSKRFQDTYAKPLEKAATSAREFIADIADTKGVFERAQALTGKERLEFLAEHLDSAAPVAYDKLRTLDVLTKEKNEALTQQGEHAKAALAEEEKAANAAVLKSFDAMRENIGKRLSVFRGENADALTAQAKSLLTGEAPHDDIIAAAFLAAAAPHYIAQLREAHAKIATFETREAERNKTTPRISGRGSDRSASGNSNGDGQIYIEGGKIPSPGEVIRQGMAALRGA